MDLDPLNIPKQHSYIQLRAVATGLQNTKSHTIFARAWNIWASLMISNWIYIVGLKTFMAKGHIGYYGLFRGPNVDKSSK
jgi:hypothetical protein